MRVLLAQTQKPPTETRIFQKLGKSLAEIPSCSVEILGSNLKTDELDNSNQIALKPIFSAKIGWRHAPTRSLQFWHQLQTSRPDVVVICSPDLLPIGFLYKWLFGKILIWDMQENYPLNVQYQGSFQDRFQSIKLLMAKWITRISIQFSDQIWLAESIYQKQLPQKALLKSTIFENKVAKDWSNPLNLKKIDLPSPYFLFSGVISHETGVLTAIHWMEKWVNRFPDWTLMIVGYCPDENLRNHLENLKTNKKWLVFENLGIWKSGLEIRNQLINSQAILMPYRESEANSGKRPTKWFEAIWANKAALVQKNSHWSNLENCVEVNFNEWEDGSLESLLEIILTRSTVKMTKEDSFFAFDLLKSQVIKLKQPGF